MKNVFIFNNKFSQRKFLQKTFGLLLCSLFIAFALPLTASAATDVYISSIGDDSLGDGSAANPYHTVSKAFQEVDDGGTVYIMDDIGAEAQAGDMAGKAINLTSAVGTVTVNNNFSISNLFIFSDSGGGGRLTITNLTIDGQKKDGRRIIRLNSGALILGNGATLQNGFARGSSYFGGGVWADGASSTLYMDAGSVIKDSYASHGAGIGLTNGASFYMSGGLITGCTSGSTNGDYYEGAVQVYNGYMEMSGGEIKDNILATICKGGGVTVRGTSEFLMSGGTISGNQGGTGGGVYVDTNAKFTMDDGIISGNKAANPYGNAHGAGVYNGGTMILNGGTISGNTGAGSGAGILNYNASLTVNDGTISGNTSTAGCGGGISHGRTGKPTTGSLTVNGGTISGNSAKWGGGIYANDGTTQITGGMITANTSTTDGGGIYLQGATKLDMSGGSITGNNTPGNGGGIYSGTVTMSGGTVSGNVSTGNGGGIYVNALDVLGASTVSGNTGNAADNNVYLEAGKNFVVSGDLSGSIGVTAAGTNAAAASSAGTNRMDTYGYFADGPNVSDIAGCIVRDTDSTVAEYDSVAGHEKQIIWPGIFTLVVNKTVTGNMSDYEREFEFKIKFSDDSGNPISAATFNYTGVENIAGAGTPASGALLTDGTGTTNIFRLKHGQSIVISGIRAGTKYTITEENQGNYTVTSTGESSTGITGNSTADFNNDWESAPPMGIDVDMAPYLILSALALFSLALLIVSHLRKKAER